MTQATLFGETELSAPGGDCCDAGLIAEGANTLISPRPAETAISSDQLGDPKAYVQIDSDNTHRLHLFVDGIHCAACIKTIESGVKSIPGILSVRLNVSTRRLAVEWQDSDLAPRLIIEAIVNLGYQAVPFEPQTLSDHTVREERHLLSCLAVAGFAAANVMLLSVSVWAGAFSDMGPATRDMFHWISACIAVPAVIYAGQPFFKSATRALRAGRMNMDVPISLAVILAAAVSLQQTLFSREHAYFDASVMLLFFLLIGRYLDHRARSHARSTAAHLLGLTAIGAMVIDEDGNHCQTPVRQVAPDSLVYVATGARIPVDGTVETGNAMIDTSLVTGETLPANVSEGSQVFAGTLNISAPISVRTVAAGEDTLLGEIVRLVEAAEHGRSKFVRVADRAARIYAPSVHILALMTFLGWWVFTAAGIEASVMAAIAVLIITCPCALGLAVPVVQVVATGALLKAGVLVKSKDGLERLAQTDTIIFDKTGTLTRGRPALINRIALGDRSFRYAAALAVHSTHPLSRAVVRAYEMSGQTNSLPAVEIMIEEAGMGLSGTIDGQVTRLGNHAWCQAPSSDDPGDTNMHLWLRIGDQKPVLLSFSDELRADATDTVSALKQLGYQVLLLSGDRVPTVAKIATASGIDTWEAGCLPADKAARIKGLAQQGHKVLMVGDGINDAPALALGHASISPASGADIAQAASDFVFQGDKLASVLITLRMARLANNLLKQNIGFAAAYNLVAVPIAVLGFATPLIAAAAMSTSSLIVTLNAFRLRFAARV